MSKKKLFEHIRKLPCVICGNSPSQVCHIRSKGSGGPDELWNLLPMCFEHHRKQHDIGIRQFIKKYPVYLIALKNRGWTIENDKLLHAELQKHLTKV